MNETTNYGDIDLSRVDISKRKCWSLDFRDVSGAATVDESRLCEPGTFRLSVCGFEDDEIPIGEIRIIWRGVEVSVVGHPTGRLGRARHDAGAPNHDTGPPTCVDRRTNGDNGQGANSDPQRHSVRL